MGYEILFLWMARMIMMSTFALAQVPFREVYFHGILRNKEGKKFSKSDKVGADPLQITEKYGTDALRLSLLTGISPGNDARFYEEKVEHYKNFVNKLWNISKFILAGSLGEIQKDIPQAKTLSDEWILSKLAELIKQTGVHMGKYEFSQTVEKLYEFTWHEFADWYIEIAKIEKNKKEIFFYLLQNILKLWHPFIPFVTEHIWSKFSDKLLMIQEYPTEKSKISAPKKSDLPRAENQKFQQLQNLITGIRNLRTWYRQGPAGSLASYLEVSNDLEWVKTQGPIIERLARVKLNFEKLPSDKKMPYFLWGDINVYLIIPHFDAKKELELAERELKNLDAHVEKLQNQLKKKDFLKKAPPLIIYRTRTDFDAVQKRVLEIKTKIKSLK
jgi:valyl-tRNA synthetase